MPLTDEQKTEVMQRWNAGESAAKIANTIPGATANMITGHVHRNVAEVSRKKRLPISSSFAKPDPFHRRSGQVLVLPKPQTIVHDPAKVETGLVTFEELRHEHCRWVYDDATYCGLQKVEGSYCAHHARIVYIAPQQRNANESQRAHAAANYKRRTPRIVATQIIIDPEQPEEMPAS